MSSSSSAAATVSAEVAANCGLGKQQRRRLAAFDFDHTIVSQNTDTVVRDLLPTELITSNALNRLENDSWTEYMAEVFRMLHAQQVTEARIRDTIRGIPEVPGFVRLIKHLHKKLNFDLIIISDSNSVFIDEWVRAHNLSDCFQAIFTNPAEFDENGLLLVRPHHQQTDCKLSASNLCKGRVLEHFVIEQDLRHNIRYDHVFYVGDGNNDICPVLRQRACDFACARQGFAMEKHLIKNRNKLKLRANLLIWRNGFELLEQMSALPQLQLQQQLKLSMPTVPGGATVESQSQSLALNNADCKAEMARRASAAAGPTQSPQ
ncbi:CG12237 [Drosophila busckii]|uniref:CG12237 n=1 Tax=Drosophila busckii TaxID=30019 RepID=A0A0M4ES26_DROBS|nr:pyridoxal phosphate phosphatase PHOSPHO2 [Drosophila busckii]ALC49027.1 CG12237 [Drosophila busckii]